MTCDQFRAEIELNSGGHGPTEELKVHLVHCAECRAFAADLERMLSLVADESAYELTDQEARSLREAIANRIVDRHQTRVTSVWLRYSGVAAVLMLSVIGVTGHYRGWFGSGVTPADSSAIAALRTTTVPESGLSVEGDTLIDMSDELLLTSELFQDGTSDLVVDSLTEAELKYLEQHFNVKELL